MTEEEFCTLGNLHCHSLFVRQYIPNGCFNSQPQTSFQILKCLSCVDVTITQGLVREINLCAARNMTLNEMWSLYQSIERLLMLFDGRFFPIHRAFFSNLSNDNLHFTQYNEYISECLNRRLSLYNSDFFCLYSCMSLMNYADILNSQLYKKWEEFENELDIVHSMVLYCVSSGFPVDIKCAHLIEVFEPLAELLSNHNNFFPVFNLKNKCATLRMCLDAIISQYGQDIFAYEFCYNKNKFLSLFVNTRNRIMHTKPNQNKDYCTGKQSVFYLVKFSLLYRCVLFSLLGIENEKFDNQLITTVAIWENWAKQNGLVFYKENKAILK